MNAQLDLASVIGMLVVIVALLVAALYLIPVLIQALWQVVPGLLVLALIAWILRGMVTKLLY